MKITYEHTKPIPITGPLQINHDIEGRRRPLRYCKANMISSETPASPARKSDGSSIDANSRRRLAPDGHQLSTTLTAKPVAPKKPHVVLFTGIAAAYL